jgi:uncharacterized protein (TIGR00299 family) protein
MKIAYLDTISGIAGDMLLAALVDAGADRELVQQQVQSLGLPDVRLQFTETIRCGFRGLRLDVQYPQENLSRKLSHIEQMLESSDLGDRQRQMALRIFRKIGQAEAYVHGVSIQDVHFHEVGAVDSIADIVGIAVALCDLGIERLLSAPPPTGSGTVQIAHGRVSIPAPATAELLKGIPIAACSIQAELTTPTGAAVLAALADGFGPFPAMQIEKIGYGAGHKDLTEQPNLLRALIGTQLAPMLATPNSNMVGVGRSADHDHSHDHSHEHSHEHHHH